MVPATVPSERSKVSHGGGFGSTRKDATRAWYCVLRPVRFRLTVADDRHGSNDGGPSSPLPSWLVFDETVGSLGGRSNETPEDVLPRTALRIVADYGFAESAPVVVELEVRPLPPPRSLYATQWHRVPGVVDDEGTGDPATVRPTMRYRVNEDLVCVVPGVRRRADDGNDSLYATRPETYELDPPIDCDYGLTFDDVTGTLSGVPGRSVDCEYTLVARNVWGHCTAKFRLSVSEPPPPTELRYERGSCTTATDDAPSSSFLQKHASVLKDVPPRKLLAKPMSDDKRATAERVALAVEIARGRLVEREPGVLYQRRGDADRRDADHDHNNDDASWLADLERRHPTQHRNLLQNAAALVSERRRTTGGFLPVVDAYFTTACGATFRSGPGSVLDFGHVYSATDLCFSPLAPSSVHENSDVSRYFRPARSRNV